MEAKRVLLIATQQHLVVIDVRDLGIFRYSDTEFPTPELPVIKLFNFVEEGFPFGASFFICGSKLFMVGGERTRPDASKEELCKRRGAGFPSDSTVSKYSRDIYVSDMNSFESFPEFRKHDLVMMTAKPSPIIIEYGDDKRYLLSGPSWHYDDPLESPTFEVYDFSLNQIEDLPDPPFYVDNNSKSGSCGVSGHSVTESSIFMRVDKSYYLFRIKDNRWDPENYPMDEIHIQKAPLPGFDGRYVPCYDDVLISFRFHSVVAVMTRPDGNCVTQYIDDDVFDPFYRPYSLSCNGMVVAIDWDEMCIVKPAIAWVNNTNHCVLYVATFRVKKLDSPTHHYKRALTSGESSTAPAPKVAKVAADSDIGTSHHYHYDVGDSSGDSTPLQEGDPFLPSLPISHPFVSITCLSKGFYDPGDWAPEARNISGIFGHEWPATSS